MKLNFGLVKFEFAPYTYKELNRRIIAAIITVALIIAFLIKWILSQK